MNESNNHTPETFAAYLVKHYIGRKGYSEGTVPEAAALADACDTVLTHTDRMHLRVICIVDRETHPQKTFGLSREVVDEIGHQCLKYTGTVNGTKLPVNFQVMEVGAEPVSAEDRLRLGSLKRKSWLSKVLITAWKLDTTSGAVWSNAPLGGLLVRGPIQRLLRGPRQSDEELRQPEIALAREQFPVLTIALLVVLTALFACELIFGVGPQSGLLSPSIQTLVALGGLNKSLVLGSGEWYRIFTSTLLHADLVHLALNGFCLYLAGTMLESFVGRRWFFALFVVGGVCGSLMSLALNPATIVSIGASGAIMGLLAAAFVCSFRYPSGVLRSRVQRTTLRVLIPSLIPLAVSGEHVDFAGHLGGALSGVLVGLVLLKTWKATASRPAFLPAATALCVAGTLAFALSFIPVSRGYHTYMVDRLLIPDEQLPRSNQEANTKAADLVARYPRDPRVRLYRANAFLDANDLTNAERELRTGLAEHEILTTKFKPDLEGRMKGMLALILSDRNQRTEAKALAQPVCGMTTASLGPLRDMLINAQLCEK